MRIWEDQNKSNSSLITYIQISPNRNSPRSEPVSKITIHHMAGNMTLPAFGAMVAKESRAMSVNYAIDSQGNIGLFCPESDRSWCSSSPWNDHRAVTIEEANDGGAPDWHVSDPARAKPWVDPQGTSGMYMADECYLAADGTVYRCLQDNVVHDAEALPSAWEVAIPAPDTDTGEDVQNGQNDE